MKIKITDIDVFDELIKSVVKIVPDVKFVISNENVQVKVINGSQTIRAFFESDCMTVDNDEVVEICFKDILTLKKSVDLIKTVEDEDECELDFDGSFISYKNDVKFKLKVVKPEIIEQYVTTDIKTKLKKVFSFDIESDDIKQVLQCANIVSDSDSKIYISTNENGKVIAEVDDQTNRMSNSIGIPISDDLDGTIDKPVALTIDNFQAINTLPSDDIVVRYTDKSVFDVKSSSDNIKLYMIITTIKG